MTQAHANDIIERYKDEPVMEYIKELWELIRYQKDIIAKQNIEIINTKLTDAELIEIDEIIKSMNQYDKVLSLPNVYFEK